MQVLKTILLFISKQAGYFIVMMILTILSVGVGIYFAVTDSNPRDAGVLTPIVTVPPELRDSFDLILSGYLATLQDEEYIGVPGAASLQPREFIVKENEHSRTV